jgi:DNA-binding beta-propeller fold protein YncE
LRGTAAAGISPGEFNTPTGITVNGKGAVRVVEHGNHRVQVLEPGGTWQIVAGKIGGGSAAIGSGLREFRYPTGIAVDGYGAVWLADAGNHRVQTMAQDGIWTVRDGKDEGGIGSIGKA